MKLMDEWEELLKDLTVLMHLAYSQCIMINIKLRYSLASLKGAQKVK